MTSNMMQVTAERGPKLFEIDTVPAKEILRNKARVCPPLSAICEILDNIFDNFHANGGRHLDIHVQAEGRDLTITENSGGISREKLEPLVRLGVSFQQRRGSIGAWGEGFKVAAFSLASEIEVRTHFPQQEPVAVHFPEGWLASPDWKVPVYGLNGSAPPSGTTVFRLQRLLVTVDWIEIMREVAVIYGHKLEDLHAEGVEAKLRITVNGAELPIRPLALASPQTLQERMAFPPHFEPKCFRARVENDRGHVDVRVVVALSARHSGETSGVYLYGNGRLFARALRSRAVGYGESGNAILRDHPSCWRLHAYVFIDADDGSEIPWQAPLKDGVSETHPLMLPLREILKRVLSPYSRFAKIARASELVPYTDEWHHMSPSEQAELLFGKEAEDGVERLKRLPRQLRNFRPPLHIEEIDLQSEDCRILLESLEERAKGVRDLVVRREKEGHQLQEVVLRALNPSAFGQAVQSSVAIPGAPKGPVVRKVVAEITESQLRQLRTRYGLDDNRAALLAAVKEVVRSAKKEKQKSRRRR